MRVHEQQQIVAATQAGPLAAEARLKLEDLCDSVRRMIAFRDALPAEEPVGLVH
jgi:hypothetical protein